VIASGSIACANARIRALKSRLLGREIAGRAGAGLPIARDRSTDPAAGFSDLLSWYAIALKSYPYGRPLLLALLRRFEIENIKLAWRAVANRHDPARWRACWIPLDQLAVIPLEACRDARTHQAVAEALGRTPYAAIAMEMWRAHGRDPLAAEFGFDRWASRAIVEAARALPATDATTVSLALAVVRERDFNVLRRATHEGFSPEVLGGALGLVHEEVTAAEVMHLASWTPARGAFWTAVPRRWQRHAPPAADWDAWLLWWRRQRRALCRRAFLESPFCLAPAVALLLLKEEEIRGLDALAAIGDAEADPAAVAYALAAGGWGA
jgi:hypothetical protein